MSDSNPYLTDSLTHDSEELNQNNKVIDRPPSENDSFESFTNTSKQKFKAKDSKKEEFEVPDEPFEANKVINRPIEASQYEKAKISQDKKVEETMLIVGYDGKEHQLVSLGTQTEWTFPDVNNLAPGSRARSSKSSSASAVDGKSNSSKHPSKSLSRKVSQAPTSAHSQKSTKSKASVRSGRSAGSADTSISGAALRTQLIVPPYPEENDEEDDEYGLPIYVSDDESEFSLGEEEASRPPPDGSVDPESLLERKVKAGEEGLIADIGPPAALQFQRESKLRQIFPEINAEDQEKAAEEAAKKVLASQEKGARCEFCGNEVTGLKSLDDQVSKSPTEQFCCSEYRQLLQFALTHPLNQTKQELIDITPSGSHLFLQQFKKKERKPRQSKVAKKPAKWKAPVATSVLPPPGAARGQSRADFASDGKFARQIKTINYQLSNLKCLEDGWTLREPSDLCEDPEQPMFVIDFEGIDAMAEALGFSPRESGPGVINKYFPDGTKFLTLFSDGSGNIFYPSGNIAIVLSRGLDLGHATYIIHQDSDKAATPLAILDSSGKGTFFHSNGNIRIWYDQMKGMELDSRTNRKRHWFWDGEPHLHAPPFQAICFAVNRVIGVRISNREHIMLSYISNSRQCKLNAGSKLKLLNPNSISVALTTMREENAELDRLKSYARSLIKQQTNDSSRNLQSSRLSRLSLQQSPTNLKSHKLDTFINASKRESMRSSLLPPLEEKSL